MKNSFFNIHPPLMLWLCGITLKRNLAVKPKISKMIKIEIIHFVVFFYSIL